MKPKFYRKVLKNGMTILLERRDIPVVSVCIAAKGGAIFERAKEKGISHFIEHMLYKGTKKRTSFQISQEVEKHGGVLDGFTSETMVGYWAKIPSPKLDVALDVLSDMINNSIFDECEIEKERKVIFEEIKMHRDSPRMHVFHKVREVLYNKPFSLPISGDEKSLKGIGRKELVKKFKEVYVPSNMVLCVVGDADFEKLVKFAEQTFIAKSFKKKGISIKNRLGNSVEKREGLDQANLVYAYHIPLFGDKKCYAAEVLNALMTGGMSSRLFVEIREKRNLVYGILGILDITKYFASTLIWAGAKPENVSKIKELIVEEFKKVVKTLSEKDLKQVKEQLVGNYLISMEDSQEQMVNLLFNEIQGEVKRFYEFEKNIRAVRLEDVRKLAKAASEKFAFYSLVPKK